MADLMHLTPERNARRVIRAGLTVPRLRSGVYTMPVLPSFTHTHQWTRELRRFHSGPFVAVDVRVPDDEPVDAGRYGRKPARLTAAEAIAMIRALEDPRGYEVVVLRPIGPGEVRRVRRIPQGIGWRYLPDAHGQRPCGCPACLTSGGYGTAAIRRRTGYARTRQTKPELMAALRAATTPDDIEEALLGLGSRSRGDAGDLAYLVDHPDRDVRETLYVALARYRGRTARELRERLAPEFPDDDGDD